MSLNSGVDNFKNCLSLKLWNFRSVVEELLLPNCNVKK